jgi:hypothetical protein
MVHDDGTVVKHGIGRLWTVGDSFRATANSLLFSINGVLMAVFLHFMSLMRLTALCV